jgi:protein-L-isoaspartate(D-aspartate) O-methyltransferase
MVAEVEAMFAETRYDTGLAAMSPAVRAALLRVERHRLVAPSDASNAYRNHPIPIGHGQTISQPYIVALSTELIAPQPGQAVLDVGTGSGYQAAVLAEVVGKVFSIELLPPLGKEAEERLRNLGYSNIEIKIGDGYRGWPEKGPFDGIIVSAAAPDIPRALVDQLKPGGRMVIPIGATGGAQELVLVTKGADGSLQRKNVLAVRFVPLVPGK